MRVIISVTMLFLLMLPQVAHADAYRDLLGKSVEEIKTSGSCSTSWVALEEKILGYDTLACVSFKVKGEFNGFPGIVIVNEGKVIGAGGIMIDGPLSYMVRSFKMSKSRLNMDQECTQLNMAVDYEDVMYQCGDTHAILTIQVSGESLLRVVHLKDFNKNFRGRADKIDVSKFL